VLKTARSRRRTSGQAIRRGLRFNVAPFWRQPREALGIVRRHLTPGAVYLFWDARQKQPAEFRPRGPAEREDPAGRVLRQPSIGQGPAPGSRGSRDRAAPGAARPTDDAGPRDQHLGGPPTDSPTGLDEGSRGRYARFAWPRAIAAPASHDERGPRLMRSPRSQRTIGDSPCSRRIALAFP
jgi:hypothetical protein